MLQQLYPRLPIFAQNLACSYYGWRTRRSRFSPGFHRTLAELRDSERWSADEIRSFKDRQTRDIVRHAYDTVPYYQRVFRERGLTPADIKGIDDLPRLPILTKDDIRANLGDLVSSAYRKDDLIAAHTSGTTGTSLNFYVHPDEVAYQWAIWWRHRMRFGTQEGDLHVNFTGKPVVPPDQQRPPYWRFVRPQNQYVINMHHLVDAKIESIVGFLNSISPRYYSGYPSILAELARLALSRGLDLKPGSRPTVIFTGAEGVQEFQRRSLEQWTGAPIADQYGHSEGCGNASTCSNGIYHEDFEFGHLECGDPSDDRDGCMHGDIIATGFTRRAMPLIRYKIGDSAAWEPPSFVCSCGRMSAAIRRIDGRSEDYVLTPEGRRIMRFDYIFKGTHSIREAQVCQYTEGEITIKVVPASEYAPEDEQDLRRLVAQWISPRLRVAVELVQSLEREPNGKLRSVKSYLDRGGDYRYSGPA